jgi:ATP-dependent Clp protease ATP-binding subunit ClpA
MTSNIGSPIIQQFSAPEARHPGSRRMKLSENGAEGPFPSGFLNRIDDIIIFQSLDEARIARIVEIQLRRLEKR